MDFKRDLLALLYCKFVAMILLPHSVFGLLLPYTCLLNFNLHHYLLLSHSFAISVGYVRLSTYPFGARSCAVQESPFLLMVK